MKTIIIAVTILLTISFSGMNKNEKIDLHPFLETLSFIIFPVYVYALSEKPDALGVTLVLGVGLYDKSTPKDSLIFGIPVLYDFTLAKGKSQNEVFLSNVALIGLSLVVSS